MICFLGCKTPALHYVQVVYPSADFLNIGLFEETNKIGAEEIVLNKTLSDQEIYSDAFHEKMFNQVWQREEVENQGLQKQPNFDENLFLSVQNNFYTSFEELIAMQVETNY